MKVIKMSEFEQLLLAVLVLESYNWKVLQICAKRIELLYVYNSQIKKKWLYMLDLHFFSMYNASSPISIAKSHLLMSYGRYANFGICSCHRLRDFRRQNGMCRHSLSLTSYSHSLLHMKLVSYQSWISPPQ